MTQSGPYPVETDQSHLPIIHPTLCAKVRPQSSRIFFCAYKQMSHRKMCGFTSKNSKAEKPGQSQINTDMFSGICPFQY